MDKLRYGVAYYREYMPYERLEEDIKLMKEANINTVRIAESTWSTYEPRPGEFDFSSVDIVLDAMLKANIDVIIGTPTYAIPAWMAEKHPEVLAETKNGKGKYGHRQIMDITNPTYLFYAERIIRKLISHVSDHPAVIGYQIDNENKHYDTIGKNVQHEFVKYLKKEYNNLDEINEKFGLDYWSNRVNDWEDFPSTIGTINGSLGSVFNKFQRDLVTRFLEWQIEIVREYKKESQFLTHNFDFEWKGHSYGLQTRVNHFLSSKQFDYTGVDIYHPSQHGLTGIEIAFGGDIARSTKNKNYLVLETQAQAFTEWMPYPKQLKLQALSHLASGANMVMYWHWHSIHNSLETYWKGLLSHDFKPNYVYDEAKDIGNTFKKLSGDLTNSYKKNDVAILVSNESLTAINWFKRSPESDTDYNDILRSYYDSLYRLNIECDIISVDNIEDISKYKFIIIPALYSTPNMIIDKINDFISEGGNVLFTFKSGFTDENVKVRHDKNPNKILESCGIEYNMFVKPHNVSLRDNIMKAPKEAVVKEWMELIETTSAEPLLYYNHSEWGKYAAVTKNSFGKGKAYYIGAYLDEESTKVILNNILEELNISSPFNNVFPIITKRLYNHNGESIYFVMNYSSESHDFSIPFKNAINLLNNEKISSESNLKIEKWDTLVIKVIE